MRSTGTLAAVVLAIAVSLLLPCAGSHAAEESGAPKLPAKDAGVRYGEAAGAVLACSELRITPRVAELRAGFEGSELAEFDAQAARIVQAWREALSCEHAEGPDDCRVSRQLSCRQALREVGPSGTALPGLIEPKE